MIVHTWCNILAACYHLTFDDELEEREEKFIVSLKGQQASHEANWEPSRKQRAWLRTIWERLFEPTDMEMDYGNEEKASGG